MGKEVAYRQATLTIGFDAYSLVARILPGYITIVPLTLPFLFLPMGVQLSFGAAALLLPILYFIGYQIGGMRGKQIEKKLWRRWGGRANHAVSPSHKRRI